MRTRTHISLTIIFGLIGAVPAALAQTSSGTGNSEVSERLAAVVKSLQESAQRLRSYEWIETTAVSFKGEEKSRKEERCYYGADGKLQNVPISAPPPRPEKKGGLKGRVAESKKEEISGTMKDAIALVKKYVPPDPALLKKSKDAGKASTEVVQPGKVVRLVFKDYQLPGDALNITLDAANNRLGGLSVASYLGKPSDAVNLDARMGALDDGTTYPADIQLAVKSANIAVHITNSGYRKTGSSAGSN